MEYPPHPGGPVHFDFSIHQWVTDTELAWVQVRVERDQLLGNSDWRVTKALESGQPLDPAWVNYRQALRDVTDQPNPANIVWPDIPN
jgi:hypothetical protein